MNTSKGEPPTDSTPWDEELDHYLEEAEALLLQKDYLGAMARLESAWRLKPHDPAIVEMQKRIQDAQQEDFAGKYESKMTEARSTLAAGEEEQAFVILETILEEYATYSEARLLRDQIIESRWQKLQEQIQQGLELAMQPLAFCDFEVASNLLGKLKHQIEIDSCAAEIERIRIAVDSLHSAFSSADYSNVAAILRQLRSKDRFGWLAPHATILTTVEQTASEKWSNQRKQATEAMMAAQALADSGQHREAIAKLDWLIGEKHYPEASELRAQIFNDLRNAKIRDAQLFLSEMNWEGALQSWTEVLAHFPEDEEAHSSIRNLDEHIQKERKLHSELLLHLKRCYSLIVKKQFSEAHELLERMLDLIQPGYRLIEVEKQIQKLQVEVTRRIQMEKRQRKGISMRLEEVRKLYRENALEEAMEHLASVLEEEMVPEEALEMKDSIEKAIHQKQLAQRFRRAFQKGKEYFDNRRWQKAIEFWKKAASIAEDSTLKGWIAEAEQRLKKERQIRLSIIAMLAETEELIFYGNFEAAKKKLAKSIRALSRDYFLEDLANQIEAAANKLEMEIRKEQDSRSQLQTELEEAALLYQQRSYSEAKERLDHVLKQHPELESAIQLRGQIESAEAENRNVLEAIRAIVKLVVRKDFKQLPALLMRLRETSSRTPYGEDGVSIVEELPLLVLEIESGDIEGMRQRLDQLFSRSLVFLQYKKNLLAFADSLEAEKSAESQLDLILQEGLEEIERGSYNAALECMQKFESMLKTDFVVEHSVKNRPSPNQTITLSDSDLRISDAELQSLEQELRRNELRQTLSRAAAMLQADNAEEARLLYERVLQIDPENTIAINALRDL